MIDDEDEDPDSGGLKVSKHQEKMGETMSDSSEEEKEEQKQEHDGESSEDEQGGESESSSESETSLSSVEEDCVPAFIEKVDEKLAKELLAYERAPLQRCVRKIPRVGQKVNLNSFECYIAVKKVPKPLEFANNAGTVSKDRSVDLRQDIEKSKQQFNHSMTYREST